MGVNLKEVRERISSVKSTQQITKAMKMVSAAKLRKAQEAIQQIRPYTSKLQEMLANILANLPDDAGTSFGVEREVNKVAVVAITSNRGLCGSFNSNIIKGTKDLLQGKYAAQVAAGNVTLYCIGKKCYDAFKNYPNITVNKSHQGLLLNLNFEETSKISQELMDKFENKTYDAIDIVYGQFKNAAVQDLTVEPFLPVPKLEVDPDAVKDKESILADYIFEPDMQSLLESLVPSILKMQFLKCNLDTSASEHGARMTAMDSATENANDLLKELQISYNKARQEAITRELSEIVGGAAALDG